MNCLPFRSTCFHPGFSGVRVTRSLVFMCMFCRLFAFLPFSTFHLVIVLFVLRYTDYDDSFWYLQTLLTKFKMKESTVDNKSVRTSLKSRRYITNQPIFLRKSISSLWNPSNLSISTLKTKKRHKGNEHRVVLNARQEIIEGIT